MQERAIELVQGTRPTLAGTAIGVVEPIDRASPRGVRLWVTPPGTSTVEDVRLPFGEALRLEGGAELIVDAVAFPGDEDRGPTFSARLRRA